MSQELVLSERDGSCPCEGGVLGSAGMCTQEIAARQHRTIAVNEAFSIEVIKMIKDSGKLIHL